MNTQEFDQLLSKYADVVIQVGLNLRKGQILSINCILEDAPLIRKLVESAYKAGAKYVDVLWADEPSTRARYEYADPESITFVPGWVVDRYDTYLKEGNARLHIASTDPDLLEGIDSDLVAKSRKALMETVNMPLRKYQNLANWCIVASAAPSWSKKVFPNIPVEEAQAQLWDAIFQACRVNSPDPVSAWQDHIDKLVIYKNYLTNKQFASLHYKAPGTDLTVGLPENHIWQTAQHTFKNGVTCTVNVPSEEVFTLPHRDKVNGHVKSTMPLNLAGTLIENFTVTFENGRAVNVSAEKGESDLQKLIGTDESASHLGEVALVPNSSPIKQSGILFYNTLFDENASCHIAFGNGIRPGIEGGVEMTDEEFVVAGGNKSLIHTDFMIGSSEMDIDGVTKDGTREPVMRQGEWAFEV